MPHETVYLVSGTNRGVGLGLVKSLASRDNVHVFAGCRTPDSATSLHDLAKKHPGKVDVVKLVSADRKNNEAVIKEIEKKVGRLDVIIANAGISEAYEPAIEAKLENMLEHFNVNTLGPLVLFQSAWPLLNRSTQNPKFIPITSVGGSIAVGAGLPLNLLAYGTSKAALNYLTRKLHYEHETLCSFPICPGPADTDMFAELVRSETSGAAVDAIPQSISVADSAEGILRAVDSATRENYKDSYPCLQPFVEDGLCPW